MKALALLVFFLLALSVRADEPVLAPNDKLDQVGDEAAQKDVQECIARAEKAVKDKDAETVAKNAAGGAVVGLGATALGAIMGPTKKEGKSSGKSFRHLAGKGALVGGLIGAGKGAFETLGDNPLHKQYVEKCLTRKGYEVMGWN